MSISKTHPILLCYDGSAGARAAIQTAGAIFPGRDAVAVYVWRPVAGLAAAYAILPVAAYDEAELRRDALPVAEKGAEIARAAGLSAVAEAAEATLEADWQVILEVAERRDAVLIVLGARGLSSFQSLVLGSVSHAVAQHSHRPVLIVPAPALRPKALESAAVPATTIR
jgi:nucleotide-binding universal stress UspA family protein